MSSPRGSSQEWRAPHPLTGVILEEIHGGTYHSTFRITSAAACAAQELHKTASPILDGQRHFVFRLDCKTTLSFLQSLFETAVQRIQSVYLASSLMFGDDCNNRDYADKLARFLIDKMDLESITLDVPDDKKAGTNGKDEGQYEWFMWTLHEAIIGAFRAGHFSEVRLAHPKKYKPKEHMFGYHNVENEIEKMLLHDCEALHERRRYFLDCYWESHFDRVPCRDTTEALYQSVSEMWKGAGYMLQYDACRLDEKGTVLVIQRTAASARPHADRPRKRKRALQDRLSGKAIKRTSSGPYGLLAERQFSPYRDEAEQGRCWVGGAYRRDRMVMRYAQEALQEWRGRSQKGAWEALVPVERREADGAGDWHVLQSLVESLARWSGGKCQLCVANGCSLRALGHRLEECRIWEESAQACRLVCLLRRVYLGPPGGLLRCLLGRPAEISGKDGLCTPCGFPQRFCVQFQDGKQGLRYDGTNQAARCRTADLMASSVAALMAFENGALVDVLQDEFPWMGETTKPSWAGWK